MSVPMSGERLAEIRAMAARFTSDSMLPELLAEVDRLRATLEAGVDRSVVDEHTRGWISRAMEAERERDTTRAALRDVESALASVSAVIAGMLRRSQ